MQWSLAFTACLSTLITIIAECAVIQTTTISNSANSVSSLTSSLNSSSIFPLGVPSIHCNGDIYRRNLRERSCINAYAGISDDRQLVSFGTRGGPVHWHIDLPFRWISDDGLCVFDIYTARQNIVDDASMLDFRNAAYNLIHECISGGGGRPEGGLATGIGRHGRLGLIMTSYPPSVHCSNPVDEGPDDCMEILQAMSTSKNVQQFGSRGSPGVAVGLPMEIANDDRSCVATINIVGPPAFASWYDIWENLVAVEGMCASNGLDGQAFAIGSGLNIFVDLKKSAAPPNTATS